MREKADREKEAFSFYLTFKVIKTSVILRMTDGHPYEKVIFALRM